jgi:hypothetical protein
MLIEDCLRASSWMRSSALSSNSQRRSIARGDSSRSVALITYGTPGLPPGLALQPGSQCPSCSVPRLNLRLFGASAATSKGRAGLPFGKDAYPWIELECYSTSICADSGRNAARSETTLSATNGHNLIAREWARAPNVDRLLRLRHGKLVQRPNLAPDGCSLKTNLQWWSQSSHHCAILR